MDIFGEIKDVNRYEIFFDTGIQQNSKFISTYELVKNLSYNWNNIDISKKYKRKIKPSKYARPTTKPILTMLIEGSHLRYK
jgi:hypothetical protein